MSGIFHACLTVFFHFKRAQHGEPGLRALRVALRAAGQDRQLQRRALPPGVLRVSGLRVL